MADKPQPPSQPPGGKMKSRASVERQSVLRDVLTHAVEAEKEARKKDGPPKAGSGRTIGLVFAVAGLAFTAFSVIVRPEFIWGPKTTALAPAEQQANLRFSMYLLGQRVRSHRLSTGRLPASLAAIGTPPPGISYSIVSDTVFELSAQEGSATITLRSDKPVAEFLGDASRRLRGAAK